jgi:cytochrome c-type biogenesis protein
MAEELSVFIVFIAGLLSFLSPCVLPLIPSYLFLIGSSPEVNVLKKKKNDDEDDLKDTDCSKNKKSMPRPIAGTVSFVLGFTVVFTVLSIVFSVFFNLAGGITFYLNIISGIIVIVLGLNVIFDFLAFLNFEKRFNLKNRPKGIIGAFLLGCAFSAGWIPCVGPVLTSILLLAANREIWISILYLLIFSIGLGLPFILASIAYNTFLRFSKKISKYLPLIKKICGILLVITGVLILSGQYQKLNIFFSNLQK